MNIEKKINVIGQLLADVKLKVEQIYQRQEVLKEFIINPDKVKFERQWRKYHKE